MSGPASSPTWGRFIVLVRSDSDDSFDAYGVYGTLEGALRKEAAINKRIERDRDRGEDSGAWAYVMDLDGATIPADRIVDRAFGRSA